MRIEFDKYVITGVKGDFVLYEKRIRQEGKSAGEEALYHVGYYSKLEALAKILCETDIRTSELTTLDQILKRIDEIAVAFGKVEIKLNG